MALLICYKLQLNLANKVCNEKFGLSLLATFYCFYVPVVTDPVNEKSAEFDLARRVLEYTDSVL